MDDQPLRLDPSSPPSPKTRKAPKRRTNSEIGKELERAIARGADDSVLVERCEQPHTFITGKGWTPTRRQGADLFGCHVGTGQAIYIESKVCEDSLKLADTSHFTDAQRLFLATRASAEADCRLVVHFSAVPFAKDGETYCLPIIPHGSLHAFLLSPWRRSITLTMARAWGLIVPDSRVPWGDKGRQRVVRWLDGWPHSLTPAAIEAVAKDQKRAASALGI